MNRLFCNYCLIFFVLLLSCQSSDLKDIDKKFTIENKENTILSAQLKQGQAFSLAYSTPFFRQKRLVFSNIGKGDTTIINELLLDAPVITNYNVLELPDKVKSFYVLINPGDSFSFRLNENIYLQIDSANKQSLLSPPLSSFYSLFDNDKNKYGIGNNFQTKFQDFYARLNATATAEKNRIENLFKTKQIDEKYLSIYNNYADQLFYKNLFTYISRENKLPENILKLYLEQADTAMKLFTNKGTILSDNLSPIFFGILGVKLRVEKENVNDYSLLFAQAKKEDFGKFKAGLLFRFLEFPGIDDSFAESVLNDISTLYPDSKYSLEAQKITNINTKRNELRPEDNLLTLTKKQLPWDSITNRQNNYIVVDFWASWCAPCRALFPLMDSIKKQFINKNVEFISINIDNNINDWQIASKAELRFLKSNNYYLLQSKKIGIVNKFNINLIPRFMIFRNGQTVSKNFTLPSEPGFIDDLNKIISN